MVPKFYIMMELGMIIISKLVNPMGLTRIVTFFSNQTNSAALFTLR